MVVNNYMESFGTKMILGLYAMNMMVPNGGNITNVLKYLKIVCENEMTVVPPNQFMAFKFTHLGIEYKLKEFPAYFKCKCGGECDLNGQTFTHPKHATLNKNK